MNRSATRRRILGVAISLVFLLLAVSASGALAQDTPRAQQSRSTRAMEAWGARYQAMADQARTVRARHAWGARYAKLATAYQTVPGSDARTSVSTLKWIEASRARYQGLADAYHTQRRLQAWSARYQGLAEMYEPARAQR